MLNQTVPSFTAAASGVNPFHFSPGQGRWLVLYFYPKDSTPGCTNEGNDFRDLHAEFASLQADVVGVSRDSVKSHDRFREKMGYPFPLLADTDEALCTQFDVIRMKNMYGKQVRGIERSTFLIDPAGVLVEAWRGVKVPGHAANVLATLKARVMQA